MSEVTAGDIYKVINFVGKEWQIFARTKLCLTEIEIEDCEYNSRNLVEIRYQMVQKWKNKEGHRATTRKLYELAGYTPPTSEPQHRNDRYVDSSTSKNLSGASWTFPQDDVPTKNLGQPEKGALMADLQRNEDTGREACTTSTDLPAKAFTSEKSTEKKHKRSQSGGSHSSSSENLGSAESMTKAKRTPSTFGKFFNKLKKPKSKTFSNEQVDMCEAVHRDKVKHITKKDEKNIVGEPNYYPTHLSPGCVLILNNSFLNNPSKKRDGAEKDVANMEELWRQIGCDIYKGTAHQEKTAEQMKALLREMTTLNKPYSYIVVIIMTHGALVDGQVIFKGVDDNDVKVADVEEIFNNENAPRLLHIPKLFIFQFCCGTKIDYGVQFDNQKMSTDKPTEHRIIRTDGGKAPTTSDMHFEYPTHEEHAAIRDPNHGSWFITAITNVFMEYACSEDVHDMLIRVRDAMKGKFAMMEEVVDGKRVRNEVTAMSWGECHCTKKLHLLPGYKYNKK